MPYVPHTTELKERALRAGLLGLADEFVAALFGVSVRSLRRWRQIQTHYGRVNVPPKAQRGRPRILTALQMREVIRKLNRDPDMYMDELAAWCAVRFDCVLGVSTLYARLRAAGMTRKRLRRIAFEKDWDACAEFADIQQLQLMAHMCVWTDESSKDGRTIWRKYGWAPRGRRAVKRVPCGRGVRYSVLPALTLDGYIAMRVVRGSVKKVDFIDFILNDVLPHMNPWPGERSILVLDNCRIHKGRTLRQAIEAAGCRIVFIPPYSPEFNPIEESFSAYKAYLRRHYRALQRSNTPVLDLYAAMDCITADKAREWVAHAGYPFDEE